jgi:hypothetical protein
MQCTPRNALGERQSGSCGRHLHAAREMLHRLVLHLVVLAGFAASSAASLSGREQAVAGADVL